MLHVLGNACRDITFRVEILPRPRETLNARITYGGLGGKGLDQAIAAARAEMDVRLIAAVRNDSAARRCGLNGLPPTHYRFPG
jgi:ribokinase